MQILNGLLWVAGDPVGRLITTLTLYPLCFFCTFWYKSNHCTSSAENLILKTRKTQCKVERHNIHFLQSQCTEAQCNVIFTLYAISSFTQAFNISLCAVSCFALFGSQCTTLHSGLPSHGSKSQLSPLTSQPTSARIQFRARTPSTVIIIISFSL